MTFADVRTYVKGLLTKSFANKTVLDKLSEDDNGKINYNNSPIQDSYSKEEFDEILKSDYKQIFDKDSNVELLNAPVSFIATKASTIGTSINTMIEQTVFLNQSIKQFDYLMITGCFEYNNTSNTVLARRLPINLLSTEKIIYNSAEAYENGDKSLITIFFELATTAVDSFGEYTFSVSFWFKNETEIFIRHINNPLNFDAIITIESIIGTKFNSTEIYKETSVLSTPTNYSLEEKCIGSWINGKPLYEKTFKGTTALDNDAMDIFALKNVDVMVKIDGAINYLDNRYTPFNATFIDSQVVKPNILYFRNEAICIQIFMSNCLGKPCHVTVQYTKTTDEENSFTPDMLSTDEIDDTITDEDIENLMTQIKEG